MPTLNFHGQGSLPGDQRLRPQVQHEPQKRSLPPAPELVKKGNCLSQTSPPHQGLDSDSTTADRKILKQRSMLEHLGWCKAPPDA